MKSLDVGRYAMAAVGALLCGCSVAQRAMPNLPVATTPAPAHQAHEEGWMLSEARSETLLYVSAYPNDVFVYAYPRPKLVGELRFSQQVAGLCSDDDGDVWVPLFDGATSSAKIVKFKHGMRRRTSTLTDPGFPTGCAVDPVTGNLAVSNFCVDYRGTSCVSGGDLEIYSRGSGSGTQYVDPAMANYGFCAYDDSGDLFVDGTGPSSSFVLAELPRAQAHFSNLRIAQSFDLPAGLQWHGKHLAISNASTIYQYSIRHSSATEVSTTPLDDTTEAVQFAVQGNDAVVPGAQSNNVAFYRYPRGGTPSVTILLFRAISAALSDPAPPRASLRSHRLP